jgi:nucleoside-diphosphate-sugar epimerase
VNWRDQRVLVTGGASFIGSALVDALVRLDARVRVVDNLTTGRLDNLRHHLAAASIEFLELDLVDTRAARHAVEDVDVVFHLASSHDGCAARGRDARGCETHVTIDRLLVGACVSARVEKVVLASCACDEVGRFDLSGDVAPVTAPLAPATPAGSAARCQRARAASERLLQAVARQRRMRTASCRYFSVYGERDAERHLITRLLANAFAGQRPLVVPGDRLCRWTYVGDVVEGIRLAAERIDDGTAVDLETIERVRLLEAVHALLDYTGHEADIQLYPDAAAEPITRAADLSVARNRLGWAPKVTFADGLHRTVDWYVSMNGRTAAPANRRLAMASVSATRAADTSTRTMAH